MWVFEPSVAEGVFNEMLKEAGVQPILGERLDRTGVGVSKDGAEIVEIKMESGRRFRAKVFIDASYEGDLMAAAKASYAVGREANGVYGETLNGQQLAKATKNQLPKGIDPYSIKGDKSSGLLSGVNPQPQSPDGSGDAREQAYCFRMCLTDVPENRLPVEKPASYDERLYELLFRALELNPKPGPIFKFDMMPNRKTDSNNAGGFSCDFIGRNLGYSDASYAEREKTIRAHEDYQKGLVWTLQNHPRIPEKMRAEYSKWGLPKDEFQDNGNWSWQLYVREARRLLGEQVVTEAHCLGKAKAGEPVGLAAYQMDSHNVQRVVSKEGFAMNEGDVQVGGFKPFPIPYGAITPKRAECVNLLVPVCLSASHIAYGSIRMEPVFMILGQSAAQAAKLAVESGKAVQDIDRETLNARLLASGQKLSWD
jgi:hypothetical protein